MSERNMNATTYQYLRVKETDIRYLVKTSSRARRVSIAVHCNGSVVLTVPRRARAHVAHEFLMAKSAWVLGRVNHFKSHPCPSQLSCTPCYTEHKERAAKLAAERLAYFNIFYGFRYNRVTIRNQRTVWGSATCRGNLSFNYKIALLPDALSDYVIVHELCHLQEMNHSPRFWKLVERTIPDARALRRELTSCDLEL